MYKYSQLQINDQVYSFRLDMNALCELEKHGVFIFSLGENVLSMNTIRALFFCALKNEMNPSIKTLEDVGNVMSFTELQDPEFLFKLYKVLFVEQLGHKYSDLRLQWIVGFELTDEELEIVKKEVEAEKSKKKRKTTSQ